MQNHLDHTAGANQQLSFNRSMMGQRSNDPSAVFDSIHPNTPQTPQQRANKQLFEINEILSKSKSTFSQIPNLIQVDQMKVFPDERPPPVVPKTEVIDPSKMKTPKVTLNRLTAEDEVLMQKSLTEFAKKSPELARKLGVIKDEADMFSQMKADGKEFSFEMVFEHLFFNIISIALILQSLLESVEVTMMSNVSFIF